MTYNSTSKKIKIQKGIKIVCNLRLSKEKDINTILFIHGFGSSKIFFEQAFSDLSLKQFNIITFDLPGFGQSKADQEFSYRSGLIVRESYQVHKNPSKR